MEFSRNQKRIIFDVIALLVGSALAYLAYFIVMSITDINQWDKYIIITFTILLSGIIIGFFAFKKESLLISSLVGIGFLVVLLILAWQGIGLYQLTGNYLASLVVYVTIGVLFLCFSILGSLLGSILSPKLWKYVKGEIELAEEEKTSKTESKIEERLFCKNCGTEIPRGLNNCEICGTRNQ